LRRFTNVAIQGSSGTGLFPFLPSLQGQIAAFEITSAFFTIKSMAHKLKTGKPDNAPNYSQICGVRLWQFGNAECPNADKEDARPHEEKIEESNLRVFANTMSPQPLPWRHEPNH
jgi:hypothetical protein